MRTSNPRWHRWREPARVVLLLAGLVLMTSPAVAADPLATLLDAVRSDSREQSAAQRAREAEFLARKDQQARLLREAQQAVARAERATEGLRADIRKLSDTLQEREKLLAERSTDLQGVAAVVRDVATEAREEFTGSLVSLDDPTRLDRLLALTRVSEVPSADELQGLWLLLQEEATALAQVRTLQVPVGGDDGAVGEERITRYGGFALRDQDGRYLRWRGGGAPPERIARQPEPSLSDRITGVSSTGLIVDPTGGLLLGLQESRPTLRERVAQAGVIGLIILALGAIGLVLGLAQLGYLLLVGGRVNQQMRRLDSPQANNPLGRVLALARRFADREFASLELAADEAVMRELPPLERLQDTVRLLAAVAPLLGLLGTVTGMIATFQAITLFGTGDPKLMAGGISQALMTTVLGLVVAVPLLFLHSLIVARSRAIVQRLDQQSAGLLASLREAQDVAEESASPTADAAGHPREASRP